MAWGLAQLPWVLVRAGMLPGGPFQRLVPGSKVGSLVSRQMAHTMQIKQG